MNVAKPCVGCVERADRCPGVTIDFNLFKLNIPPTGFGDKGDKSEVGRFFNRASDIRISSASPTSDQSQPRVVSVARGWWTLTLFFLFFRNPGSIKVPIRICLVLHHKRKYHRYHCKTCGIHQFIHHRKIHFNIVSSNGFLLLKYRVQITWLRPVIVLASRKSTDCQ